MKPLRIYFYKEGLVRIATEDYSLNKTLVENKFIHLTNIAINKKNINFKHPKNSSDEDSNTWNLLTFEKFLKNSSIEWNDIRTKIKDIITLNI